MRIKQENLEEAARSMELVEPALVGVQKATPIVAFNVPAVTSMNWNARRALYLPKVKSTLPKDINTTSTTKIKSSPKRTGTITHRDYTKTKCYNCNQLGYLSKDCPALRREQPNGKPLGKNLTH